MKTRRKYCGYCEHYIHGFRGKRDECRYHANLKRNHIYPPEKGDSIRRPEFLNAGNDCLWYSRIHYFDKEVEYR